MSKTKFSFYLDACSRLIVQITSCDRRLVHCEALQNAPHDTSYVAIFNSQLRRLFV